MKATLFSATLVTVLLTGTAQAAPVSALSELVLSHGFAINNGNAPAGLEVRTVPQSLTIEGDATSLVNDPGAVVSEIPFVQVGNPFSTPPLPFIASRTHASQLNGGFEGAAASLDVEITTAADPDPQIDEITRRDVDQQGSAVALLLDDTISASASSYYRVGRDYRFTNTTNAQLSFNISGMFSASLLAELTGGNGIARAAGGFGLEFSELVGAQIAYFSLGAYAPVIDDGDFGATVTEQLLTHESGVTGIRFSAAATALGSGGTTRATYQGDHGYLFGVILDPGADVRMAMTFSQANGIEYSPAQVPLPASVLLLVMAVGSLLGLRRRSPMA